MENDGEQGVRRTDTVITTAVLVVLANLVVFVLAVPMVVPTYDSPDVAPQEIWWPALQIVGLQAGLSGLLLVLPRGTRPVGIGIVVGTTLSAVLLYAWILLVLATAFS